MKNFVPILVTTYNDEKKSNNMSLVLDDNYTIWFAHNKFNDKFEKIDELIIHEPTITKEKSLKTQRFKYQLDDEEEYVLHSFINNVIHLSPINNSNNSSFIISKLLK